MKEKVTNKLEKRAAEVVMIAMFIVVLLSSCGVSKNTCSAYASIECENCDEID